jgi:hypothetical protein
MDATSEHYRFYVYTETKRGQTPQQIILQLRAAFGDSAPCQTFVYKWAKGFQSGVRETVKNLPIPGRPISLRNPKNISRVYDFITNEPKSTVALVSESLDLCKTTVRSILIEELLFRKVCSVWIPHFLSDENKLQRIDCASNLIHLFNHHSMDDMLRTFAVEDETWVPFKSCGTKQQNKVWIPPQAKRPRIIRPELTPNKTLVSLAFTGNGKVSVDVTEKGETIDSDRYVKFIHSTGEHWRTLRSDPTRLTELLWMHDNARPHSAIHTKSFLERRRVTLVKQSPYSPDLNLCDRWLFKHLKGKLSGCQLQNATDVRKEIMRIFSEIPVGRFEDELRCLKDHCVAVVACQGDYVTK